MTEAAPVPVIEDTPASEASGQMLQMDAVHTYYGHIHALRGVTDQRRPG